MATKKTVTPASSEKKVKKAIPVKKTSTAKLVNEELIRKKAQEIYHERVKKGIHGTPEEDWHKAEKLLKAKKK